MTDIVFYSNEMNVLFSFDNVLIEYFAFLGNFMVINYIYAVLYPIYYMLSTEHKPRKCNFQIKLLNFDYC